VKIKTHSNPTLVDYIEERTRMGWVILYLVKEITLGRRVGIVCTSDKSSLSTSSCALGVGLDRVEIYAWLSEIIKKCNLASIVTCHKIASSSISCVRMVTRAAVRPYCVCA